MFLNNGYYNVNDNMNGYSQQPGYNPAQNYNPQNGYTPPISGSDLPMEQSYIENILRLNKGKIASVYMSFPDSNEWRDKIFTGVVEQAARDHIVISDPKTGKWYLLLAIYIDYIVFDEEINYKVI